MDVVLIACLLATTFFLHAPRLTTPTLPPTDPVTEMVAHFPSDAVIAASIAFGNAHSQWIENRIKGGLVNDCREEWREYLADVHHRISLWEAVREIRCKVGRDMFGAMGELSDDDRRERIRWLQAELGDDYIYGWLPPVIDVRRVRAEN